MELLGTCCRLLPSAQAVLPAQPGAARPRAVLRLGAALDRFEFKLFLLCFEASPCSWAHWGHVPAPPAWSPGGCLMGARIWELVSMVMKLLGVPEVQLSTFPVPRGAL